MDRQIPPSGTQLGRPEWLASGVELERLIVTANPEITIKISDLQTNKNNSDLVEAVLQRVLSARAGTKKKKQKRDSLESVRGGSASPKLGENEVNFVSQPNDYELLLARLHLAVEIQSIMVRWCLKGQEETEKTSILCRSYPHGRDVEEETKDDSRMDIDICTAEDCQDIDLCSKQPQGPRSRSASTTSSGSGSTMDSRKHSSENDLPFGPPLPVDEQGSKRRKVGEPPAHINPLPKLSLNTGGMYEVSTAGFATVNQSAGPSSSLKRKRDDLTITPPGYSPLSAMINTPGTGVSPKSFRHLPDISSPLTGGSSGEKVPYLCPFYVMNPSSPSHKECESKTFPNPRKLKEHIWRWTKPFKCPTCNEGFGREKTKAIHCQQRKNPCRPRTTPGSRDSGPNGSGNNVPKNSYEGSKEQRRDQKIEAARSTSEIIKILEEYEQEEQLENEAQGGGSISVSGSNSLLPSFTTPSSPSAKPSPSTAEQKSAMQATIAIPSQSPSDGQPKFSDPFRSQQKTPNTNSPSIIFSQQQSSSSRQRQSIQVPDIQAFMYDVNAMTSPNSYTPERVQVNYRSPSPLPSENHPPMRTNRTQERNRMDAPMCGFAPFFHDQGNINVSQGYASSEASAKVFHPFGNFNVVV